MDKIKIALAEDHQLVRQGMVSLLQEEEDLHVVFDVSNGSELLEKLESSLVDIVLLDLDMPIINGQQALKFITENLPKLKVIIISSHYSDEFIWESVNIGARGFLPKNSDIEEVIAAIHSVYKVGYYFDDKLSKESFKTISKEQQYNPENELSLLTKREIDVLKLICDGKKNKDISTALFISLKTVESHRQHIYSKTNCKNIAKLLVFSLKNGYYKIES